MPKPKNKTRRNALERDPRFERFAKLYIENGGKAYPAAKAAGYAEAYARGHGHDLASRVECTCKDALRAQGYDAVGIARKLSELAMARAVKWNPKTEEFDSFADGGTQMAAVRLMKEIIEPPILRVAGKDRDGADVPAVVQIVSSIPRPAPSA